MKRRSLFKRVMTGALCSSFCLRTLCAQDPQAPEWIAEFNSLIEASSTVRLFTELAPSAIYANELRIRAKSEPETTVFAALNLWIAGRRDHLLLTWYRETSRPKRAFLCALLLCERIGFLREPLDGRRTDFEVAPARFTPIESKERLEELEHVKQNARILAKRFHEALSKVLPPEKLTGFAELAGFSDPEFTRFLNDVARSYEQEKSKK